MDRRTALELVAAAAVAPLVQGCGRRSESEAGVIPQEHGKAAPRSGAVAPSIFLAHGSPYLLDDAAWTRELRSWAVSLPRPSAVLVISAHWVDKPFTIAATETVPLVYDFYGFPEKYYAITYRAPGAPALAARVRELVQTTGAVATDPRRGLDHGAYVPLVAMYPDADVPVLQVSMPTLEPAPLIELGRALAPLRREGVLVLGSGFLTHNLRAATFAPGAATPSWASEFDAWAADAIARRDADELAAYRERAPGVRMALPTHEHFAPLLVSLGTSLDLNEPVAFPISGFTYGSFTKRSVQFG
jgi:4,5-DOPA dioxygenase extradiol